MWHIEDHAEAGDDFNQSYDEWKQELFSQLVEDHKSEDGGAVTRCKRMIVLLARS